MGEVSNTKERLRLLECRDKNQGLNWRLWGPYLSERQWGTVREDYSSNGDAWNNFSRYEARYRAYRWGEDGIGGISDDHQRLCFSIALWNRADDAMKERLFGLTNGEGNNGEDVKEYYYYLDSTPTHSYMKYLYKYPCRKFPETDLLDENARRKSSGWLQTEYELINTGILDNNNYFDVLIEYAKASPDDILIRITVTNRGDETRALDLLPTLWFRNVWSWGHPDIVKPSLTDAGTHNEVSAIRAAEYTLKDRWLYCRGASEVVYTENDTNREALKWGNNDSPYVKDGIDRYIRTGDINAVNPGKAGTKAAACYRLMLNGGAEESVLLRLTNKENTDPFGNDFSAVFNARQKEADEFYNAVCSAAPGTELYNIQRQAFAGMLWSKQLYYYIVKDWLDGDKGPAPPHGHTYGRNNSWQHLYSKDILSMPDKWEYPWFAAWDLAFHTATLAIIDPDFAKSQMLFLIMEWYMHPNGMMPAYEWDFGNINPPVQAWAAWRIYRKEKEVYGTADADFLRRIFNKLNMNFTWWINQADRFGNNIFEGGFLGLDNIRIIDSSAAGGTVEQSDGTAWMAMYCLNMMSIGAELVNGGEKDYRDLVRKYFQHFLYISSAMNSIGGNNPWNEDDKFYFDMVRYDNGHSEPLKVFSLVGLVPLFAIEKIDVEITEPGSFYDLSRTYHWFSSNRKELISHENINIYPPDPEENIIDNRFRLTLSLVGRERLKSILERMLDEDQFLSPFGIRSLSKYHEAHPYSFKGRDIRYEPAESREKIMGGNSNWRGPIWFPVNYLIIEALRKFHTCLDGMTVSHKPAGGDRKIAMTLAEVADDLSQRLISIFTPDAGGRRPVFGGVDFFNNDAHKPLLFYEYFHGDNGAGIGASHQTGWTGLVANIIDEIGKVE